MAKYLQLGSELLGATNGGLTVVDAGLDAARLGLAGCGKVNEKDGINASATVLTDAGMLIAIPTGKQIVVTCFYAHLNTASDYVDFELGYTAVADGSGTFTAVSPKFRIETGAANQAGLPGVTAFPAPIVIKNTTGKAFTFRAQTNDADAVVTFGFNYWLEDES